MLIAVQKSFHMLKVNLNRTVRGSNTYFKHLLLWFYNLLNTFGKRIVFKLLQHENQMKPTPAQQSRSPAPPSALKQSGFQMGNVTLLKCVRKLKGRTNPPCILLCDECHAPQQGMERREEAVLSGCSSNPNSPFAASFFPVKGKSIWLTSCPQRKVLKGPSLCIFRLYGTCVTGNWISKHSSERQQIQCIPLVDPILGHKHISCSHS